LPAYLLTKRQVRTALDMAGIEVGPASPLTSLPPAEQPLSPDDAAFRKLAEGHLLEPQDGAWRVNILAKAVLLACARPEEVISLLPGAGAGDSPGFSVCRRGPLLSECTVGGLGLVKLAFPLSRSTVILMLTSALSSERPEPLPTGFLFRGRAEDAFVLSVVLAEARDSGGPSAASAAELVASAVQDPNRTLPFVLVVGAEPLLGLARSRDGIEAALGRLAVAGHVRNEGGRIVPSEAARHALEAPPVAGFGVSRVLVGPGGPAAQGLQVMRCGERNIVFRLLRHAGEQPLFEWSEVTRQQLRSLVGAVLMDEKELEAALSTPAPPSPAEPAAEAMFCPSCGRPARTGQHFCRFCGHKLVEDAP
jgi:hypothetical protein